MYLSYDEYSNVFNGAAPKDKFTALEKNTEHLFDIFTRLYYQKHKMEEDKDEWRVMTFKKAMAIQIDYLFDNNVDTADELTTKGIKSVSIDGTSVTSDASLADTNTNGLSNTALDYLFETGLLYRGVPYLC